MQTLVVAIILSMVVNVVMVVFVAGFTRRIIKLETDNRRQKVQLMAAIGGCVYFGIWPIIKRYMKKGEE